MFKRFLSDRRGNVAMMFGIAAIPIIAATGAAVDYSRAIDQRNLVQDALDAAALTANRLIGLETEDEIYRQAEAIFRANTSGRLTQDVSFDMDIDDTTVTLTTDLAVPTAFLGVVGVNNIGFEIMSQSVSGGMSLEVALVLDITQSMSGSKIADLRTAATSLAQYIIRDEQTPYYSKIALVPYSTGVNLGTTFANTARGTLATQVTITGASWKVANTERTISTITQANPAQVTTTSNHGYTNGQVIYINGLNDNGNNSFADNLNDNYYTIANASGNTFTLNGVNSSSFRRFNQGSGSGSNGKTNRCATSTCALALSENASGTPYATGTQIFLRSFTGSSSGYTALNNNVYTVGATTSTSFVLNGTYGPDFNTYSGNGGVACQTVGCEYYRFTNTQGNISYHHATTCATERTDTSTRYTDAPPATALVGPHYPASSSDCPTPQILPLTSNESTVTTRIGQLGVSGTTAGQIGIAWGWYLLSPTFGSSMWTGASAPAAYDDEEVLKVAVIMTDGAFNTSYCNGVVSQNYNIGGWFGGGGYIDCDAQNGDPFDQARALCEAMKDAGIVIYTVGFDIGDEQGAAEVMEDCASSSAHSYTADDGAELQIVFNAIGTEISQLRLAQ